MPPVDIYETEEAIILTAELPGVDPTHITIEVRENTLTLCGERRHKHEIKEENYHRIERAYGSFQRAFTLPSAVNHSQVKATYRDGVLEITLPKAERVKARQVKIAID
jgi:HSP20 family protein